VAEPLDPLATAYLESLAGKAPGTLDAYRRALRHFLAARMLCRFRRQFAAVSGQLASTRLL